MAPGTYTELFFLDEATALAAGHRPCFECRRADAERFRAAWAEADGGRRPRSADMDAVLHGERLDGRAKRLHTLPAQPVDMPDGVMLTDGENALLLKDGRPWLWSPQGYRRHPDWPKTLMMLTPPSIVGVITAGYQPHINPSATNA